MVRERRVLTVIVATMMVVVPLCGCITEEEPAKPGPSILDNIPEPVGDIAYLTDLVGSPRLAAELLVIATLFNATYPDEAALIAKRTGGNGTVEREVSIHIWGDPHMRENMFAEVFYHTARGGDPIAAALNAKTLSGTTLASSPGLDSALIAYGPTFNNRNAAWAMMTGMSVEGVTTGSSDWRLSNNIYTSPIVLDMDGDKALAASGGEWLPHPLSWALAIRPFDLDGDGFKELCEWVGPKDGLLTTWSPDTDVLMTGAHLFGDGDGWPDGFAKLARLDADGDGQLKGDELSGLHVWQDDNGDAVPDMGEVTSVKDLGITGISVTHQHYRGTFVMDGKERLLWDWYPNALEALGAPATGTPSPVPTVTIGPLDRTAREASSGMASGERFSMDNARLLAQGLGGSTLVTVLDTGTALLLQRVTDATKIAQGLAWDLILVSKGVAAAFNISRIPLPVRDVLSVVPTDNMQAAVVVADSGATLLEANFVNHTAFKLVEAPINAGKACFRFGAPGTMLDGRFYSWGAFVDEAGRVIEECVASFPLEGGCLTAHHDLRALFKAYSISPTIGTAPSDTNAMFAVPTRDGTELWALAGGKLTRVANGTGFKGLWGCHKGTLYLLDRGGGRGTEVIIHRPGMDDTILGAGDYSYPMLGADGGAAAVVSYNWTALTMDLLIAHAGTKWALAMELDDIAIGPVRLSDSGAFYAHLSSQGLQVGPVD